MRSHNRERRASPFADQLQRGVFVFYHRHSLKEVLDTPGVMSLIKDTKAAQEVQALKEFFAMLTNDSARACYGPKHVEVAHERLAIQTLLMTDTLFRHKTRQRSLNVTKLCNVAIAVGEIKKYEVLLANEESDSPKESSSTPPVHMCLMARGNNEVSSSLCNNDDICDEDDDDDLTENIYVISKILHKAKNNSLQRFQDVLAYFENCNDSLNHEQAKSEQLEHELEKSHQACRDLRSSK
ncbi:Protein pelota [Hordeum vulgare]|nr:Protein pelota [Hordeum vulgare]